MAEAKAVKRTFYLGTGRRKSAVARVRLAEGNGKIEINGRQLQDYFTEDKDRAAVIGPLEVTEMVSRLDVLVNVRGGGFTGQSGAISQGLARALKNMYGGATDKTEDGKEATAGMAKILRDSGFLTRDGRMKERKKYGRKGARKSFQFSKR